MRQRPRLKDSVQLGLFLGAVIVFVLAPFFESLTNDQLDAARKANEEVAERCMKGGGR